MESRTDLVHALCRLDAEAVTEWASDDVAVFAPDDRIATPGVVDGRGRTTLRVAVDVLAAWSGRPLRLDAQAHDPVATVLELATRDGRPVTARLRWEAGVLADVRLYFDPEDTV